MSRLAQLAVNSEGFVFDPGCGESFTVNPVGLVILNGLRENKSTAEIAENLTENYEVSNNEAERDIADFKTSLKAYNLL